jgi:hypothetical protein
LTKSGLAFSWRRLRASVHIFNPSYSWLARSNGYELLGCSVPLGIFLRVSVLKYFAFLHFIESLADASGWDFFVALTNATHLQKIRS